MKVKVNDNCIGCGSCISLTDSKIFNYNDDGLAECIVDEISESDEEVVENAIAYCPTSAIEKVESNSKDS